MNLLPLPIEESELEEAETDEELQTSCHCP